MATARNRNAANGETAVHKVPATALAARRGTAAGSGASNGHEVAVRQDGGADELRDFGACRLCGIPSTASAGQAQAADRRHKFPHRGSVRSRMRRTSWPRSRHRRGRGGCPVLRQRTGGCSGGRRLRACLSGGSDLVVAGSGQPESVLDWEQAHLPGQFAPTGGTPSSVSRVRDKEFSLPPVPGVLYQRTMVVTVVAAGGGQTAVRVDGWVIWIPAPGRQPNGYRPRPGSSRPKCCRETSPARRAADGSGAHHRPRPGAADHLVH